MKLKFSGLFIILILLTGVAGYYVEKYCYRLPTKEEMSEYHAGHFSTKLIKLEHVLLKKKNGAECVVFKGLHESSGVEEVYHVEAGKRWVMPWQSYSWKNDTTNK